MNHSTGNLRSMDGLELYYQRWYPSSAPRASVAIMHGVGGHSGQSTYTHLINHLVPLGYSMYGLDLRGHGRSQGRRNSVKRWEDYRSDLRMLLQFINRTESNQPIFLLGQSLGGLIVLEYALHYHQELQGVIASAPAFSVANMSPIRIILLKVLSIIWPHLVIKPNINMSGISRDPEEVKKLLDDPLTEVKVSLRLAMETLSAGRWIQAHASSFRVPLLLIHGTADPIALPDASRTFFECVDFDDRTLKLYDGGFHQAFVDINRQQVLTDVAQWLDKHLQS